MRRILGGVILLAGVVLMISTFLFTLGVPVAIIGLLLLLWPSQPKTD